MKNLTLIFLALAFFCQAQTHNPQAHVLRITPSIVCPGDSIKVDFKITAPTNSNVLLPFILRSPGTVVWQGDYHLLLQFPKETFAPLAITDSCYYIKFKVPNSWSAITGTVEVPEPAPYNQIPGYTPITFTVLAPPVITLPTHTLCSGTAYTFNPSGAVSYTYSSASAVVAPTVNTSYTISGTGSNGCIASTAVNLTVLDCTTNTDTPTGIEKIPVNIFDNSSAVEYYDIYGRKTYKQCDVPLLEVIKAGDKIRSRKIFFSSE